MSKRDDRRVKLSDFKDRKALEGSVEIEADDGQVFKVPPPELWPDETMELLAKEELVDAARLIMGTDQYDAFKAAGGSAALMMAILKEQHGITVPE